MTAPLLRVRGLRKTFGASETLVVRRAHRPVHVVRFPGATFFARLRHKLGWGGLAERDVIPHVAESADESEPPVPPALGGTPT